MKIGNNVIAVGANRVPQIDSERSDDCSFFDKCIRQVPVLQWAGGLRKFNYTTNKETI